MLSVARGLKLLGAVVDADGDAVEEMAKDVWAEDAYGAEEGEGVSVAAVCESTPDSGDGVEDSIRLDDAVLSGLADKVCVF